MRKAALALILSTALAGTAAAQIVPPSNSKPEAYAKPTRVPAARDVPYPGTVDLTIDVHVLSAGDLSPDHHCLTDDG